MGSRPVFQYELDGKYVTRHPSIAAAASVMGCNESTIRRAIDKYRNSCGFIWKSQAPLFGKLVENTKDGYKTKFENSSPKLHPERLAKLIPDSKHVKILLIDVETAPLKAFTWGMWKQNVAVSQLISDFFIISWAAKWLDENEVVGACITPEEALKEDDYSIMKDLWELIDQADIVIGHNGNKFDIPKINTRFVVHGFNPPSSYKIIDTRLVAKNQFGFSSNKLQHLANSFGIEGKYDTDFELWKKCLEGDEESLNYMLEYNMHDVEVLEEVYLKLRPYIKNHPNLDIYNNDLTPHCSLCGSNKLKLIPDKYFYTQAVEYQLYRCEDCGGLSRAKKGNKILHKKVISAIPK
jgi:hypothetical protein